MPTWRERIAGEGPQMGRHHRIGIIGGSLVALGTFVPVAVEPQSWYPLLRTGGRLSIVVAAAGFAAVLLARFRHTSSLVLLGIVAGGITLLLYSNGFPNGEANWRPVPWGWIVILSGAALTIAADFCAPGRWKRRRKRVMVADPNWKPAGVTDSTTSPTPIAEPALLTRMLSSLTFTFIAMDVMAAVVLVILCLGRDVSLPLGPFRISARSGNRDEVPSTLSPNDESPEELVRNVMIATIHRDPAGVLRRIVANPDAHLIWEQVDEQHSDEMVELFRTLPIERLKVGDPLADPFTPGQPVRPEMIDADHLILIMHTKGKSAWTYVVQRQNGEWRVNMDWYIALLKHSAAIRSRAATTSAP